MTKTQDGRRTAADPSGTQATIERAVTRLAVAGMSRKSALSLICDKLTDAITCLNAAGIGETSRLRNMLMVAVAKGDQGRSEGWDEDGGDHE